MQSLRSPLAMYADSRSGQMKHHISRHIQYARDEHAKRISARAYLRARGKAVDPSAVRDLVMRDKRRRDRFARSTECAGMREIRDALEKGTEVGGLSRRRRGVRRLIGCDSTEAVPVLAAVRCLRRGVRRRAGRPAGVE